MIELPNTLFPGEIKIPLGMMLTMAVILVFLAILFLQSGIDKIADRKGNLAWLTGHFAKSPLANLVPALLGIITVLEVVVGIASIGALILLPFGEIISFQVAFYVCLLAATNLLMLFFGQRMAKDYVGAAGLVPYLLVTLVGLVISMGYA